MDPSFRPRRLMGLGRFNKIRGLVVSRAGLEPATLCLKGRLAASTVFSQLFPFVAITRLWGVCFRSQRLRLTRLISEFSDGFFTVVAITAMLYRLRSLLLQYWFSSCNSLARREDALRRARGPTFP